MGSTINNAILLYFALIGVIGWVYYKWAIDREEFLLNAIFLIFIIVNLVLKLMMKISEQIKLLLIVYGDGEDSRY